jgi:caa(3)-type oxidase subunit IV
MNMHHEHKPVVFEHQHAPPNSALTSTMIFFVLAGLTLMALIIGFAPLGTAKIYASLGCAVVQALVLAFFSMELKHQDKLTWLVAAASIFWTFLLFLFTITDYLTRRHGDLVNL